MASKPSSKPQTIYQLKVTLRYSKPPIWRRIEVPDNTTLAKLHDILQIVMGWTDSHLHQFTVKEVDYSNPAFQLERAHNEKRTTLQDLALQPKMHFDYIYDFGDTWEHDILFEKSTPPEPGVVYPRCIKGKLACPPDDCGGIWGYYSFLEAIEDPDHPEHEDMLDWIGGEFDPEAFDLDAINKLLRTIK